MERRRHMRSDAKFSVDYRTSGSQWGEGTTQDISMGGMSLATDMPIRAGEYIVANLNSPVLNDIITVEGRVTRESDDSLGISFLNGQPSETLREALQLDELIQS